MDDMDPQNHDSIRGGEGESSDEEEFSIFSWGDCIKVDDKSDDEFFLIEKSDDELEEIWFRQNCTILKQEEVAKLQEDDIALMSTVFCVSKSDACLLLIHSNWRTFDLADAWFDDEQKIREKTGLLEKPLLDNPSENQQSSSCRLCSDSNSSNISASCGHVFCGECWRGYIRKSINEKGAACLMLRCPEPECSAAVGPDLVENVKFPANQLLGECYKRYKQYLLRSYFKDQKLVKWCPAPDCNSAIWLDDGGSSTTCYYVSCVCSRGFCWNCEVEENHHPVDCETAKKWISKYNEDSKFMQWILDNIKRCPKCKIPVERKYSWDNSMTCPAPCSYKFCWFCLGPFITSCDCRSAANWKTQSEDDYKPVEGHKNLDRFRRWKIYEELKENALGVFDEVKKRHGRSVFLLEACKQMIECRQILRWTLVYGYYNLSDDHQQQTKRNLFYYLQEHAESSVERLESEVQQFLLSGRSDPSSSSSEVENEDFSESRVSIEDLTHMMKTYFKNLVRGLEEGLPETCSDRARMCNAVNEDDYWVCDRCTFFNPASTITCSMCSGTDE